MKGVLGFPDSKRHSNPTKGTVLGQEFRLVTVFFRDLHLPVSPFCVQRIVHGGVAETIDAVAHAGDLV